MFYISILIGAWLVLALEATIQFHKDSPKLWRKCYKVNGFWDTSFLILKCVSKTYFRMLYQWPMQLS